jgi:hypothetical protein
MNTCFYTLTNPTHKVEEVLEANRDKVAYLDSEVMQTVVIVDGDTATRVSYGDISTLGACVNSNEVIEAVRAQRIGHVIDYVPLINVLRKERAR